MSRHHRTRAATVLLAVALIATGCGDTGDPRPSSAETAPSPADPDASREDGDWLLRFTTAGGADGEKVGAVYVRYNPSTGAATARALPTTTAANAGAGDEALLVSADHAWAIQDTAVPKSEARTGKLLLYAVADDSTDTLDIRAATGKPDLQAVAWAFDPTDAHVLRVVDADNGVWKVDLAARTATQESTLQLRDGWIFGDGFDKNTGEPYIESIDTEQTEPAGNGDTDTRAIARQAGTVIQVDGGDLSGMPKPPCGFAGAFRFDDGDAWLFCADTPSISAYRLGEGDAGWVQAGKPSPDVVPGSAVELTFALPPLP